MPFDLIGQNFLASWFWSQKPKKYCFVKLFHCALLKQVRQLDKEEQRWDS